MTKNRRIFIALCVLVLVNLALLAYIVGNHLATHNFNTSADPSFALTVMARSLPPERIEELMPGYLTRLREDVRPHYRKLRAAQTQWYRALTAKDLDREELEQAIDNYWLVRHSAQSVADTVFVEMILQLSEDERTELLRDLRRARSQYDDWRQSRMQRARTEETRPEPIQSNAESPSEPTETP